MYKRVPLLSIFFHALPTRGIAAQLAEMERKVGISLGLRKVLLSHRWIGRNSAAARARARLAIPRNPKTSASAATELAAVLAPRLSRVAGSGGVPPGLQDNSKMGFALAVGEFDGNAYSDLAIGIPYRDQTGIGNLGAESILYGALFADGFASGNAGYWSETQP